MLHSWLTLVPPILVIIAAIITRHIHVSLIIGIVSASLVATHGVFPKALVLTFTAFWQTISNIDNLYLYGFILSIGFLVSLFTVTGFAISFAQSVTQKIHSARQAQYASMIVSVLLLIDDYLSILTAGYVMGPLIDRFRIAREKLAFLVHSFAGPIVILAPVSSWVAAIIAYMDKVGIAPSPVLGIPSRIVADPFFIYLKSLPFMLYSLLTIATVWFIVHRKISFGPMHTYEIEAAKQQKFHTAIPRTATMKNILIPISVLVVGIAFGLPFAGGYYLFGGTHSFIESIKYNEHPFLVMFLAVLAAIGVTIIQALIQRIVLLNQLWSIISNGFKLMFGAILMVFFASILSGMLANQVGTGQYIASLLINSIPLAFLPVMFFIASLICTIATGSAWGNFALMIPIAVPMLTSLSGLQLPLDPQALPLLLPILGAIFSGSVCGDHISPLSETTTMTATSTETQVITHAYTQIFYMLPAIVCCAIGYTVMGLLVDYINPWINVTISVIVSGIICLAILWLLDQRKKKN